MRHHDKYHKRRAEKKKYGTLETANKTTYNFFHGLRYIQMATPPISVAYLDFEADFVDDMEETKKARLAWAMDLDQKAKDIAELQQALSQRDKKLAEAQQAQADLLRKQRELDDAKRELELTVEKRVQAGLDDARDQARKEAEEGLKLKVMEKEQTIAGKTLQEIEGLEMRALNDTNRRGRGIVRHIGTQGPLPVNCRKNG